MGGKISRRCEKPWSPVIDFAVKGHEKFTFLDIGHLSTTRNSAQALQSLDVHFDVRIFFRRYNFVILGWQPAAESGSYSLTRSVRLRVSEKNPHFQEEAVDAPNFEQAGVTDDLVLAWLLINVTPKLQSLPSQSRRRSFARDRLLLLFSFFLPSWILAQSFCRPGVRQSFSCRRQR